MARTLPEQSQNGLTNHYHFFPLPLLKPICSIILLHAITGADATEQQYACAEAAAETSAIHLHEIIGKK
jgi:hypothetical protein